MNNDTNRRTLSQMGFRRTHEAGAEAWHYSGSRGGVYVYLSDDIATAESTDTGHYDSCTTPDGLRILAIDAIVAHTTPETIQ